MLGKPCLQVPFCRDSCILIAQWKQNVDLIYLSCWLHGSALAECEG